MDVIVITVIMDLVKVKIDKLYSLERKGPLRNPYCWYWNHHPKKVFSINSDPWGFLFDWRMRWIQVQAGQFSGYESFGKNLMDKWLNLLSIFIDYYGYFLFQFPSSFSYLTVFHFLILFTTFHSSNFVISKLNCQWYYFSVNKP